MPKRFRGWVKERNDPKAYENPMDIPKVWKKGSPKVNPLRKTPSKYYKPSRAEYILDRAALFLEDPNEAEAYGYTNAQQEHKTREDFYENVRLTFESWGDGPEDLLEAAKEQGIPVTTSLRNAANAIYGRGVRSVIRRKAASAGTKRRKSVKKKSVKKKSVKKKSVKKPTGTPAGVRIFRQARLERERRTPAGVRILREERKRRERLAPKGTPAGVRILREARLKREAQQKKFSRLKRRLNRKKPTRRRKPSRKRSTKPRRRKSTKRSRKRSTKRGTRRSSRRRS